MVNNEIDMWNKRGASAWQKRHNSLEKEFNKVMNLKLNLEYWNTMTMEVEKLLPIEDFGEVDNQAEAHMNRFENLRQSLTDERRLMNDLSCKLSILPTDFRRLKSKIRQNEKASCEQDASISALNEELGVSTHNLQAIAELMAAMEREGHSKLSFMQTTLE